jgi:3-deoxy-7-phosphoheptulonate synthase
MIIVMKADVLPESPEVQRVVRAAQRFEGIRTEVRKIQGQTRVLTEIYLLGPTGTIPQEPFEEFPAVEKVIRIRERYRTIGRHQGQRESFAFEYNGVRFGEEHFNLFAGVCAVDTRENLEAMFRALQGLGIETTRAGAYNTGSV